MDFATALLTAVSEGISVYKGYINDPKRIEQAQFEAKMVMKKKVLEIIRKEASVEEADKLALALLTALESL
jgi:hypothetical protein